jgi:hypothetical protein
VWLNAPRRVTGSTPTRALVRLADGLELRQRADEASAVLRDALLLYERKGNVVAAERVQRRLVSC